MNKEIDEINKKLSEYTEIVKEGKKGFDAEITEIVPVTNHEYYGSKEYEKKQGIKVVFVLVDGDPEADPLHTWFNIPDTPRGAINPEAKINKFISKYNTFPKVGLKIKSIISAESGFYDIDY